jgi:hypothetical protein
MRAHRSLTKPALGGDPVKLELTAPMDESEQQRYGPRSASTAAQIRAKRYSGRHRGRDCLQGKQQSERGALDCATTRSARPQ